jgi:hypothetical protein
MTFFSSRVVPKAPPSLLMLWRATSGSRSAALRSMPTSDQVPEEM